VRILRVKCIFRNAYLVYTKKTYIKVDYQIYTNNLNVLIDIYFVF
jgi:hypothetical protein